MISEKNIKAEVIIAGHICLDILPVFSSQYKLNSLKIFSPGALTNMDGVIIAPAGAVPNVGISLARLGQKCRLIGKVGNDFFGKAIKEYLKNYNILSDLKEDAESKTSYTIVIAPPGIDRTFFHDPGANNFFSSDDINYETLDNCKLFHFGYPPLMKKMYENGGYELLKIFKKIKSKRIITSLDLAYIEPESNSGQVDWYNILKRVLPCTDIFMPSLEEITFVLNMRMFASLKNDSKNIIEHLNIDFLHEYSDILLAMGVKIVAIKCGSKGFYIRTASKEALGKLENVPINLDNWANREFLSEAYMVSDIKSTTGAGDVSIAGFLVSFLRGVSIEDAVRNAQYLAAKSIQSYSVYDEVEAFENIPSKEKINLPPKSLLLPDSDWKFDINNMVWEALRNNEKKY